MNLNLIAGALSTCFSYVVMLVFYLILAGHHGYSGRRGKITLISVWLGATALFFIGVCLTGGANLPKSVFGLMLVGIQWLTVLLVAPGRRICMYAIYINALVLVDFSRLVSRAALPEELQENKWIYFGVKLVVSGLLLFLILWIMRPLFSKLMEMGHIKWGLVLCLSIVVETVLGFLLLVHQNTQHIPMLKLLLLCISVFVIVLYICFYYLIESIYWVERIATEKKLVHFHSKALDETVMAYKTQIDHERVFKHDLKHYANIIGSLVAEGKNDAALESITALLHKIDDLSVAVHGRNYCDDPLVNNVLQHYERKFEGLNINFNVSVVLPKGLRADGMDFAIMLSNLLENAMNACKLVPVGNTREVRVMIKNAGQQNYLKVENSCFGQILLNEEGNPVTQEKGHGWGTQSVLNFVEKYHGVKSYKLSSDTFMVELLF